MRVALALATVAAVATATAAVDPAPLGPCGPIERAHEPIIVEGRTLGRLGGTPIARLGLVAVRDGTVRPIPFQVDEKKGRRIALPEGPKPSEDDRPGVLDAEDLLVFMACDAGERSDPGALAGALAEHGLQAWREIRVADPVHDTAGFAYLVVAERPPATDRRYVDYDPAVDLVRTARYRVGMVNALPAYLALAHDGHLGPNLLDGVRLRARATLRADLAHWTFNEQEGRHRLLAWKTGPVRVVRRSKHDVKIGLGIHLTAGVAHTYFYPQHVFGPGSMKLPFSPAFLFRDITAFGGADGRDLVGWHYHAPGVPPRGFHVDGRMDDAEKAFASEGDWFALSHRGTALVFVTRMSENLAREIRLRLVYRDDAERAAPPEMQPGTVPLVGYEGRHVERLPRGRYRFQLTIYGLDHYRPGDEAGLLTELDAPLTAETTARWPLSGPPAP